MVATHLVMSDSAAAAQRRVWTIGDYSTIAAHLLPISIETIAAVTLEPGDRVLDVGVGDGNAAIAATRCGARVTGIDLTPVQIDRARSRCAREGVEVDLRVGVASVLELPDSSFDVVLSVMGMIFAPDHVTATAELVRVCRPGGTVAVTAWAEGGWSTQWRARVSPWLPAPPPGAPMPDEWGDPQEVTRRFQVAGMTVSVVERPFHFDFPSVDDALDTFVSAAGPFVQMVEMASKLGRGDEVLHELRASMVESNEASDGTCLLSAPYLLAIGIR
jgi:SAM-dependent methyltransferase